MTVPLPQTVQVPSRSGRIRVLLAFLAGGLVVCVMLVAFVLVMWPQLLPMGFLKRKIEMELATRTGRAVSLEAVRCESLLPPLVRLSGLKVAEDPVFPKGDFFSVGELTLQVPVGVLFGGQLRAESASIAGLKCMLFRRKDGTWNWESVRFLKSGAGGAGEPKLPSAAGAQVAAEAGFELSSFAVKNSQFNVIISEPDTNNEKGELVPGGVSLFACDQIQCNGVFTKQGIRFDKMEAGVAGGRFTGTISLTPNGPSLDFGIKGTIATARMEHLLAALSAKPVIVGELSGNCDLNGRFTAGQSVGRTLTGTGHVDVKNGEFPSLRVGDFQPKKETPDGREPAGEQEEPKEPASGFPIPIPKLPKLPFPAAGQTEGVPMEAKPVPDREETPAKADSGNNEPPAKAAPPAPAATGPTGTKFHLLAYDFSLSPGEMKTTKIICQTVEETDVTGDGSIDYTDETVTTVDYRLDATLTPEMVEKLKQSRPAAALLSSILGGRNMRVPVRIKGEIDHPTVEVDYTGFARSPASTTPDSIIKKLPLPF